MSQGAWSRRRPREPRAGDVVGEVPAVLNRNNVVAGMDDQGGRADRRQDRPHVDPEHRFQRRPGHPGLALMRSNIASRRIDRTDGKKAFVAAPLPHAEKPARPNPASRRSASSTACSPHPNWHEACPQLGRSRSKSSHPPARERENRKGSTRAFAPVVLPRTRWRQGHPRCTEKHRSFEADGIHDGLDLGRSIIQRPNFRDRVRQPDPCLVEHKDATKVNSRSKKATNSGTVQYNSTWLANDPANTSSIGPSPKHLIRQAQIAAGCVRRFRHGRSVLRRGDRSDVSDAGPSEGRRSVAFRDGLCG